MKITIEAKSPISHGEFKEGTDIGNSVEFRRIPIIKDGKIYDVPVLSGNSTRGVVRRLLAREMVDKFNLKDELGAKFDKFYIAVANGGNLDKSMDTSINPQYIAKIRKTVPMLSLFGAALYKFMLTGIVNIGFAVPRCYEFGTAKVKLDDILHDVGMVRQFDKNIANFEDLKPMPYTLETVNTGTVFDLEVSFAPQTTEIEKSCLNHGFKLLTHVGGRKATGFGCIEVDGYGDDECYLEWLGNSENIEEIKLFAEEL